jgi:ADP-heptose:LPS heptosyltransferase
VTHIRKLLSLFKQLVCEPRYAWQILKGLPTVVARHVLFGHPILCIRRYAGIGDIICTFPSLMTLRRTEPTAVIIYETRRPNVPLVAYCQSVDLVVEEGSPLAWMCQRFFTLKMCLYPLLPDEYTPKRHCDRIHLTEEFRKSFDLRALDKPPVRLEVTERANRRVRKWLEREGLGGHPLVVIHAGPTWKTREWPIEHWADLVTRLKSESGAEVVQIGHDTYASGETCASSRARGATDWVGRLSIDQMLALLKVADLFVGIDSGMLHLAGAVGTSCVGIFGPTDPSCRLPIGSPSTGVTAEVPCLGCHHDTDGPGHWMTGCPYDIRCMSSLKAEDVFRACLNLLKIPGQSDLRGCLFHPLLTTD